MHSVDAIDRHFPVRGVPGVHRLEASTVDGERCRRYSAGADHTQRRIRPEELIMDPRRFDALAKAISIPGTRRAALGQLIGMLAVLLGRERTQADGSGAFVGGGGRGRKRDRHHDKEKGRKRRGKRRKDRDKDTDTCGKPCGTCRQCKTCLALGEECSRVGGLPCCTDVADDAVCAGNFISSVPATCQDCDQPPTEAGALCKPQPGNQCCGGSATCFVGVRINDVPACFASPEFTCQVVPCTDDFQPGGCPGGVCCGTAERPVCIKIESPECCGSASTTACAVPCPPP